MKESQNINEPKLDSLKQQLKGAGIDFSSWGTGGAKTLEHLQKEIEDGETVLMMNAEGKLIRTVTASAAEIFYTTPDGRKYRLREGKQVFKDGRERKRNFRWSISEKMKKGENPRGVIIRGLQEELDIRGEVNVIESGSYEELPTPALAPTSQSYPGLQSQFISHKFTIILDEKQYKPEGYVEQQPDKNTYFIWEEIK